jgi:glucose-6-phosphate isomerase
VKKLNFVYTPHCLIEQKEIKQVQAALAPVAEQMRSALLQGYATDYASLSVPDDASMLATVQELIADKKRLNPTVLVIIGIGGSNLGTRAFHEALYGTLHNERPGLKVYYLDTVDTDSTHDKLERIEHELRNNGSVLVNVVSKSGTTLESAAQFSVILELLKRYTPAYQEHVVVTTDRDSALWRLAHEQGFACLEIPRKVGGRYSVFSPVGLFPLGLIGVDIEACIQGARAAREHALQVHLPDNPASIMAALLAIQYAAGLTIHDTFLFSPDLESFGKWYRQLVAESLGKATTTQGQVVNIGLTPTVSIGSTDLHSMVQLYLAGPHNRFTTFIAVENARRQLQIPDTTARTLAPAMAAQSFATLMHAILQGTQKAYERAQRPFVSWVIPEKNAWYIGQLMQYKMMEVMYLGSLWNINPFDQPHVELYKQETQRLLAHE